MGWTGVRIDRGDRISNIDILARNSSLFVGSKWHRGNQQFTIEVEALRPTKAGVCGVLKETDEATGQTVRLALIILMRRENGEALWKEMTELEGPAQTSFPRALFNQLSPLKEVAQLTGQSVQYAIDWRKRVEAVYDAADQRKQASKDIKPGSIIELSSPVSFHGYADKVCRFRVLSWGLRRRLMALCDDGHEFACRLRQDTWKIPFKVVN